MFVYLVGGILYQKYRVGAEGFELIPHFWFWLSLPALVKVKLYSVIPIVFLTSL